MLFKHTHSHPKKHGRGLGKYGGRRVLSYLFCTDAYLLSSHFVIIDKHQMAHVLFSNKKENAQAVE